MVKGIAESLRPFSIVEDEGFKDFAEFLCNVNGRFVIPSRFKLRKDLSKISSLTTSKMREMMKKDMKYFFSFDGHLEFTKNGQFYGFNFTICD